jgi:Flp pilus assembly protein TadG
MLNHTRIGSRKAGVLRRRESGQTLVEFALVLPVLCMVLFGIIQFGITFNAYITLTNATRAGARQGAISRGMADPAGSATAKVRSSAKDLDQTKLTVAVSSTWAPGADVTVTATYPYSISLLGHVVKSGNLTSSTTERVE